MTDKKISEFPLTGSAREKDFVPIVSTASGLETKRILTATLKMSEGAAEATSAILALEPIHYWPCELPHQGMRDVVSGQKATAIGENFATPAISPFNGARRININSAGGVYVDTGVQFLATPQMTIIFCVHPTANAKHFFGNLNAAITNGFLISNGNSFQNQIAVQSFNNGVETALLASNGSMPLNENTVVAWTYNSATGHRLFANGTQVFTSANTNIFGNGNTNMQIRRGGNQTNWITFGMVHDCAIFDKVLSDAEILNVANLLRGV